MRHRRTIAAGELLRSAAEALTLPATPNIWETLVYCLGEALSVDWVLVGKLVSAEKGIVRTLAAWQEGRIVTNFDYDIEANPPLGLQPENFRIYLNGASGKLRSEWLKQIQAEAFGDVTLLDSLGLARGTLAIAHSEPIAEPGHIESMLRIFAFKAAAELEREIENENVYRDLLETLKYGRPKSGAAGSPI